MKTTTLFFALASFFVFVRSSIVFPLFNEKGESIQYEPDFVPDRSLIERCLNSNHLIKYPGYYAGFIQWLFTKPLFTFEDFDGMVDRKLVPLETAHVAFSRFVTDEDTGLDGEDSSEESNFGETLQKFFKSFDGFHDEFVNICRKIIERKISDEVFVTALFDLVEELQGDFKKCLTDEKVGRFILDEDVCPVNSYWFCYNSMIESDWFTPSDLGTLLALFEFDIDPSVIEKAKALQVDLDSSLKFVRALGDIGREVNEVIKWITSQSWVTDQLLSEIILNSGYKGDESTLELDLIMHEKATFSCVPSLRLEKFKISNPKIPNVFCRIVQLIKRDADREQLLKYIASIRIRTGEDFQTTLYLIKLILNSFPEHFYPAKQFFPKLIRAYDGTETNDQRRTIFVLVYLSLFSTKMNEEDLDYLLDFLFAIRPFQLRDETVQLWILIAETILRASFERGQSQVHLAKRSDATVFAEVQDITNYISFLAAKSLDESIVELKQAHTLGNQFIEKLSSLGKYEKVFLMLTAPTVSKLYFYAFKSLDPSCVFIKNARRLNSVYNQKIRNHSYLISKFYSQICGAYRKEPVYDIQNWSSLIDLIKNCYSAEEHVADHWMIQEMAEMMLDTNQIGHLRLTPENIELLRTVFATKPSELKRDRPSDLDDEREPKRPRKI